MRLLPLVALLLASACASPEDVATVAATDSTAQVADLAALNASGPDPDCDKNNCRVIYLGDADWTSAKIEGKRNASWTPSLRVFNVPGDWEPGEATHATVMVWHSIDQSQVTFATKIIKSQQQNTQNFLVEFNYYNHSTKTYGKYPSCAPIGGYGFSCEDGGGSGGPPDMQIYLTLE